MVFLNNCRPWVSVLAQVSWSRGPQWEPSRRDQTHESGEPVTAGAAMDPAMDE